MCSVGIIENFHPVGESSLYRDFSIARFNCIYIYIINVIYIFTFQKFKNMGFMLDAHES